jgi:hypothetical protein
VALHEGTQGFSSAEVADKSDDQVISYLERISLCDYSKILLLLS